jgi:D-alanine-D-alanine ligase
MTAQVGTLHAGDASAFGRVAVLMGGQSSEREISLISGKAVLQALQARGVEAVPLDLPVAQLAEALAGGHFDRVWNALHGGAGEDGALQGLLECLAIPYTGSGVMASSVGMDKLRSKQLFEAAGLTTPPYRVLRARRDLTAAVGELGLPLAVKPNAEGSSVGVARVASEDDLEQAWAAASRYGDLVIAEQWVNGDEYTAGILQGQVLPLVRIEAASGFYDYQAKYFSNDTRYHCPSGLPAARESDLAAQAMRAYEAIGASGWGRVDFLLQGEQALFLELNTVPGMTRHSLVPMAAREAGIDFETLVWRVLETSLVRAKPGAARLPSGAGEEEHDGQTP